MTEANIAVVILVNAMPFGKLYLETPHDLAHPPFLFPIQAFDRLLTCRIR